MNAFEWIVLSFLTVMGLTISAVLILLVKVLDRLQEVIDLFTEPQPLERLHSLEEQEQVELSQPVNILDVLLGRKDSKFDPHNVGTFKGRRPWH